MGLNMKESKTRITHTLQKHEGNIGFDFLGFHIRQYQVGKHRTKTYKGTAGYKTLIKPSQKAIQRHLLKLKEVIRRHRAAPQVALIQHLNPIIRGWRRYYRTVVSKETFSRVDTLLYRKLVRWAYFRHGKKTDGWCKRRYWRAINGRKRFATEISSLAAHDDEPITRHVKVRNTKSPFDGDWAYWTKRLGHDPIIPQRVARLMRQQRGRCGQCNLSFTSQEVLEVHHMDGNHANNKWDNLQLLHGHCHDRVHATATRC
jgi:RNA-directed DNA polymerase